MADGVKIRIVGDDSDFVRTLENLEKRTHKALRGVNAQLPSLTQGLKGALSGLSAQLRVTLGVGGGAAEGIAGQKKQVIRAAADLAEAARQAMAGAEDGYSAGEQMAEGFRRGLAGKRRGIVAAASAVASAAVGAMRDTLQIRSPSRVTMQMGEYAGQGFEIGLTRSLQSAVRSAGHTAGELNLSPRTEVTAAGASAQADSLPAGRPIYLNVDGRTLAQVIAGDMRQSLNRRSRSIGAGLGR